MFSRLIRVTVALSEPCVGVRFDGVDATMNSTFRLVFAVLIVQVLIAMLRFMLVFSCVTLSHFSIHTRADEAIVIATGGPNGPKQPQASVAADGIVHVVFGSGEEVSYCNSTDGGKSFTKSTVAFRVPNLSLGMRRGPRITSFGDSLIVTAIGGKQGKGRDGDLLAWRSNDRGASWKGPAQVNDSSDSAREGLHAMAVSANGESWCTWLDLRNQRTELYAAKSVDGGASWSPNQLVYRSPEKSVCECCHPSVAIHNGKVQVLFRNSLRGNRDMYLTTLSPENNSSETIGIQLGKEHWKLNACPMDGGMLAIDAKGLITTVWRRDRQIFVAKADGTEEQLLGSGEQPWITSTKDGPIAVWNTRRDGELLMQSLSCEHVHTIAKNARDAVVVTEPEQGTTAFVFWEQNESGRTTIFAKAVQIGSLRNPG